METFNILIATKLTDESLKILHDMPNVHVKIIQPSLEAIHKELRDTHAIITRDDLVIDQSLIDRAENLKIIAYPSTSINNIDIDAATKKGIIVMNTPGISAMATGEFTMGLILALSRNIVDAHISMQTEQTSRPQTGTQLHGKTLGIIGLGHVGHIVAQRALAFGMIVLANDPYIGEDHINDTRIQLVNLKELLNRSDFVTVHVPATIETSNLFDCERIRQMKPGARLINTAHKSIFDEQAVIDALKDGHLAGVGIDVADDKIPNPFIGLKGVIHTPHISDNTVEAMQDLSLQIVKQVLDALQDKDYRNVINMPFIPGVNYETIRPYLTLAERMGMLQQILARQPIKRIAVEFRGDEVSGLVKPLTVALLKGLLKPTLKNAVSYINAPILISELGIQVTQVKGLKVKEYTNLVSCQVTLEDGEEIVMSGTLLDHKVPHIMQINDYNTNFVPAGRLLILGSYDKPGVIGHVGTLLANNNVNIASWHTGRAYQGGQTLTVLTLDDILSDKLMETLLQQEFIRHAHQVEL